MYCVLGSVLNDTPLNISAVLANHSNSRLGESLTTLGQSRAECSSRSEAISFGEPWTHSGTGAIREVVEAQLRCPLLTDEILCFHRVRY